MKLRYFFLPVLVLLLESPQVSAQTNQTQQQQVYQGTINNSKVTIYKCPTVDAPYAVKAKNAGTERNFFVVKWQSDLFSYLMIEKKNGDTFYYPLGWTDLASISIADLQQRSRDILAGKVPKVDKNNL
jgi:hypothetical protein